MKRRGKKVKDPLKGRVLNFMVPDASQLPADIDRVQYNVHVRFVRKEVLAKL